MEKLGAHARRHRFAVHDAHEVARFRLHLDDVGAVFGEDLRGERADHDRGQVDDAHAFEGAACHRLRSKSKVESRKSKVAHRNIAYARSRKSNVEIRKCLI